MSNPTRHCYLWAAVPILSGIAVSLLFFSMARDHAVWELWTPLVPFRGWPIFRDLWITMQHLREAETGADLLSDPNSEFAYPRAVLALRYLGLQHLPAEWLGLVQGVVFTLGVIFVVRPYGPRRALVTAAFLLSPAMVLGFERGNLDFTLFTLCAFAGWLWSRSERKGPARLAISALVSAAVLKLYPVFALFAGAIAESARRRLYWVAGLSLVFVYFFSIRSDLSLVRQKVPIATNSSWGSLVSFAPLEAVAEKHYPASWLAELDWGLVALLTYGLVILAAALVGWKLAPRFANLRWHADEWCYFWIGAGICCGCFTAANFVYRWAFALFTLPLLLRATRSGDALLVSWARAAIGVMFIGFIAKLSLSPVPFTLVQLANWLFIFALIVGASGLYFSTSRTHAADDEEESDRNAAPVPASAAQT